jgi:hypothetical protein
VRLRGAGIGAQRAARSRIVAVGSAVAGPGRRHRHRVDVVTIARPQWARRRARSFNEAVANRGALSPQVQPVKGRIKGKIGKERERSGKGQRSCVWFCQRTGVLEMYLDHIRYKMKVQFSSVQNENGFAMHYASFSSFSFSFSPSSRFSSSCLISLPVAASFDRCLTGWGARVAADRGDRDAKERPELGEELAADPLASLALRRLLGGSKCAMMPSNFARSTLFRSAPVTMRIRRARFSSPSATWLV